MECKQVEPLLDLLDGEDLSPEEAEAVHAHLQDCPGCRHRLSEVRSTVNLLSCLGPESMAEEVPDTAQPGWWADMADGVMERLAAPAVSRVRPGRGPLWFGSGFAAAAGLLLALWLGLGRPAPPLAPDGTGPGVAPIGDNGGLTRVTSPLTPLNPEAVPVIHLPAGFGRQDWPFNTSPRRRTNLEEGGVYVPAGDRTKADF